MPNSVKKMHFLLKKNQGKCYNNKKIVGRLQPPPSQKQSTRVVNLDLAEGIFILTHFLLNVKQDPQSYIS